MRKSLGSTKPTGTMKVKVGLGSSVAGSVVSGRRRTAGPSQLPRQRGGARAYTLGPERW